MDHWVYDTKNWHISEAMTVIDNKENYINNATEPQMTHQIAANKCPEVIIIPIINH